MQGLGHTSVDCLKYKVKFFVIGSIKILQFSMGGRGFHGSDYKECAVLYMTLCSLLKIYQHFSCSNMQGRGLLEGERSFLRTVGRLHPDCVMTDLTG